jgi:hypothetical protein
MTNDLDSKGEKVIAAAHGGQIDIQGITVAHVNEAVQLQSVETWFDPLEMFRQIAPNGIVNKAIVKLSPGQTPSSYLGDDAEEHTADDATLRPDTEENVTSKQAGLVPEDAVAAPATSEETEAAHLEMSKITAAECPFLMNKE